MIESDCRRKHCRHCGDHIRKSKGSWEHVNWPHPYLHAATPPRLRRRFRLWIAPPGDMRWSKEWWADGVKGVLVLLALLAFVTLGCWAAYQP